MRPHNLSRENNTMDLFDHVDAMINAIAWAVACAAVVQIIAHAPF